MYVIDVMYVMYVYVMYVCNACMNVCDVGNLCNRYIHMYVMYECMCE